VGKKEVGFKEWRIEEQWFLPNMESKVTLGNGK